MLNSTTTRQNDRQRDQVKYI